MGGFVRLLALAAAVGGVAWACCGWWAVGPAPMPAGHAMGAPGSWPQPVEGTVQRRIDEIWREEQSRLEDGRAALLVNVLDWWGSPLPGVRIHIYDAASELLSEFPDGDALVVGTSTNEGVVTFSDLEVGSMVQLGIAPTEGITVRFDAIQWPVVHRMDGSTVLRAGAGGGLASRQMSSAIPISQPGVVVTTVRIARGCEIHGTVELAGCDSCTVHLDEVRDGVRSTLHSVTKAGAGPYSFVGVPPGDGYELGVVCRRGDDYFIRSESLKLSPGEVLYTHPAAWVDPGYEIRLEGHVQLPSGCVVVLRLADRLTGKKLLIDVAPGDRYRVVGLGALSVVYAGLRRGSGFELVIIDADTAADSPAVISVRRKS